MIGAASIAFWFTGFWRSLVRHRLYSALNIGGLTLGLAVFIVLSVYVRFELSYDRFFPGSQDIYFVETAEVPAGSNGYAQGAPTALWSAVERDLPATLGTRALERSATVVRNGIGTSETLALVDASFPAVFRRPAIAGNYASALKDPTRIVVTQTLARKYFGTTSAVGQTLTIKVKGVAQSFSIAAVIADWPANSDINFDILAPLVISDDPKAADYGEEHSWEWWNAKTYVVLPTSAAVARFAADLKGVVARHAQGETPESPGFKIQHRLQPLTDLHFEAPGKRLAVASLSLVALLTLVVAIVNYVNLATARAGLRAREVAMRKVLGADRGTLLRHYMAEALATAAIAAAIGCSLAELAMPLMNASIGLDLKLRYFGADGIALPLVAVTLIVGLLAGIYPASILSRYQPSSVLASARSPGGGRAGARIRAALVIAQFAIAIAFVIGTFVMSAQIAHVRAADVGYRREQLMLIPSLAREDLDPTARSTILNRLAALPQVAGITVSDGVPGPGAFRASTFLHRPDRPDSKLTFSLVDVGPRFFETIRARFLAGRAFDPGRPADVDANYRADFSGVVAAPRPINIVINRAGVRALGFASPQAAIGRDVTLPGNLPQLIVGVVEDMRFGGAHDPVPPTAYHFLIDPPGRGIAIIRYRGDAGETYAAIHETWLGSAPAVPFKALTATANLDTYNRSDDHTTRLFTIGAVLAVVIGCVGLWGLASFNTARRVREIGIRKTLGASSTDIGRLLVGQFLRPVLIANLFAWPIAYVAMRVWLAGFDSPVALSPGYFLVATMLAIAVALLTVLAQSLRASRAAPAWALRRE